jgi:hypothetical protein
MTWPGKDNPMVVRAEIARQLERKLAEANHQVGKYADEARQAIDAHGAAVIELAAVKQTMGELCESCGWSMRFPDQPCRCELERELADLKECVSSMSHPNIRDLLRELAEAREQRDEALSDSEFLRELYALLAERCDRRTVELAETRDQRDRLAVICGELIAAVRINSMRDTFREATPNQIEEWLKQWVDKLAAVKGGTQ